MANDTQTVDDPAGKGRLEIAPDLLRYLQEPLVAGRQFRELILPDGVGGKWVRLIPGYQMPVKMGHGVSEQCVVYLQGVEGLDQRFGHVAGVRHESMLQIWSQMMEFSYMVLEDQEGGAFVELPVTVKDGRGHIQFGNFLRMVKASLCEQRILAHQAIFLCCHVNPMHRQPERIDP